MIFYSRTGGSLTRAKYEGISPVTKSDPVNGEFSTHCYNKFLITINKTLPDLFRKTEITLQSSTV